MTTHDMPPSFAKVTGIYRWFDGAHFDHGYYRTQHARLTWALMQPLGLQRFECERAMEAGAPKAGAIVATSNAWFASLAEAQAALARGGAALAADVPNYTNIRPELRLSEVWVSGGG